MHVYFNNRQNRSEVTHQRLKRHRLIKHRPCSQRTPHLVREIALDNSHLSDNCNRHTFKVLQGLWYTEFFLQSGQSKKLCLSVWNNQCSFNLSIAEERYHWRVIFLSLRISKQIILSWNNPTGWFSTASTVTPHLSLHLLSKDPFLFNLAQFLRDYVRQF